MTPSRASAPGSVASRPVLPTPGPRPPVPAFEVTDVVIRYGETVAVDGVSLSSPPGRLTALLGPNGAGKSSLLEALCTARRPDRGRIRIFGHDTRIAPHPARARLGLVFQERTLDKELSVERNLRFHAQLFGMRRADADSRIRQLLDVFALGEHRRRPVEALSGGTARRVELVRALLHRPGLLILDEPTTGLDPRSRRAVWDDLRRLRDESGLTALYSTHYLDEAEHADEIVIMSAGRVGRRGSAAELKGLLASSRVVLGTEDDARAATRLRAAGFTVEPTPVGLQVRCADPERRVADLVLAAGVPVRSVSVQHPSLDDVYEHVAGGAW